MQNIKPKNPDVNFRPFNQAAIRAQRFSQPKGKQSAMSVESGRKRISQPVQEFSTSDDEPNSALTPKSGNRTEKNKASKKKRKRISMEKTSNGRSDSDEFVSGSGLEVAIYRSFPTNSVPHYADALKLKPRDGSINEGKKLFSLLIKPITVETFMATYWEKEPLLVHRRIPDYYRDLISMETIDKMLREHHVEFTKNIDVVVYKNGVRETLNPVGRALPPCVWDHYSEGNSIRILNPQTFLPGIHSMNATLQEYFQCMVGANVYLTPQNSQGFAPHYDDIEAFVLQVEGKKRWRIYKPKNRDRMLPRVSSEDFDQDEIGEPYLDVIVEPGDLLYFPRGFIHQAITLEDYHSLHITVSVYQKQTYGDLLETLIPMALKEAIDENEILRRGLPLNIWQRLGVVNADNYSPERDIIIKNILKCFDKVCNHVRADTNLDNAVDQMATRYQHDALPPKLTPEEELRCVYSSTAMITPSGAVDSPRIEIDTKVRLIRANILRLVRLPNEIRVYYSSQNSKEYHAFDETFVEVDSEVAPAVEILVRSYPKFITPAQLDLEDNAKNLEVAQLFWERGILMTEQPLM